MVGTEFTASSIGPGLLVSAEPNDLIRNARERLDRARALKARLTSVSASRSVENTWALYDELLWTLAQVLNQSRLLARVHPRREMRETGERVSQEAEALVTELDLDPEVFAALSAIERANEDDATRFAISKTLRRMRRNGATLDLVSRRKAQALQAETVSLGLEFDRNIQENLRSLNVLDPGELEGLPPDFLESHRPGKDGTIRISTAYPDAFPILKYATRASLRKRLVLEFLNQAYPANLPVLGKLLVKRHALAVQLGYPSFAAYATEDKMVGSPDAAADFIQRLHRAALPAARAEYAALLARKQTDDPRAESIAYFDAAIFGGDVGYYTEKIRSEKFGADSRELRAYFPFARVRDGVMEVTASIFGVTYRRVEAPDRWHPSVEVFDVLDGGRLLGRFYLDMHPREGKYTHAMCSEVVLGVEGRALPEAALVCNFPEPGPDEPALMEPSEVLTFFHEFGHLLHVIFSGHGRWTANVMGEIEWDFVEAPSQFLEEWVRDPATLQKFSRHFKTGEPIPLDLARRWADAEQVSRANVVLRLVCNAAISLDFYRRDPSGLDTTSRAQELWRKYQLVDWVEGAHVECRFGHLNGYSALYYTYGWSLAIAKDLFERYRAAGALLNPSEGARYRRTILEPGSSRPAAELVREYLGRDFSLAAFERWLSGPGSS